jgi:hypothetical protein
VVIYSRLQSSGKVHFGGDFEQSLSRNWSSCDKKEKEWKLKAFQDDEIA